MFHSIRPLKDIFASSEILIGLRFTLVAVSSPSSQWVVSMETHFSPRRCWWISKFAEAIISSPWRRFQARDFQITSAERVYHLPTVKSQIASAEAIFRAPRFWFLFFRINESDWSVHIVMFDSEFFCPFGFWSESRWHCGSRKMRWIPWMLIQGIGKFRNFGLDESLYISDDGILIKSKTKVWYWQDFLQ